MRAGGARVQGAAHEHEGRGQVESRVRPTSAGGARVKGSGYRVQGQRYRS